MFLQNTGMKPLLVLYCNYWKKAHLYEKCTPKTIYSSNQTCQEHELLLWLREACNIVRFESMKLWAELSPYDLQKSHSVHTLWCLLAEHVQFNTPRGTWTSSIYPRALREMMNLLPGESEWISMKSDQREKDTDRHRGMWSLTLFNPRWMIYGWGVYPE